jgi:Holliday junction resolvase-like predicted endonuclease
MDSTHARGMRGEDFACAKLKAAAMRFWRAITAISHSEIDIIAQKEKVIAFIEVKTRERVLLNVPRRRFPKRSAGGLFLPP